LPQAAFQVVGDAYIQCSPALVREDVDEEVFHE